MLFNLSNNFALPIEQPVAVTCSQANVGLLRFARAVDHAAHNRHFNGGLEGSNLALYPSNEGKHIELESPAGGASDYGHAAVSQSESP